MNENQIYSGVADVLTDKPFTMVVPVKWAPEPQPLKRSLIDKLLFRKPLVPERELYREFTIYPCVVANMYRIAGRAALLPDELTEGGGAKEVLALLSVHMPDLIYIIAAAIQNNHLEPDADLMLFIERNFTQDMILVAFDEAIGDLGLASFLNSIALVKGTTQILKPKASPADGRE